MEKKIAKPFRSGNSKSSPHVNSSRLLTIFLVVIITISIEDTLLVRSQQRHSAFAANSKIVNEVSIHQMNFQSNTLNPVVICGVSDTYELDITLKNYHYVLYEDGTFRISSSTSVEYSGGNGEVMASSRESQVWSNDGANQFNQVINCNNGGGVKQDLNYHLGFTIKDDGTIGEMHLVYRT